MRLFVAVPVPERIKERVAAIGREICQGGITPVRPENMHLTLRFIGTVSESDAMRAAKALQEVRFAPFECALRGVGAFPNEDYVLVVYAGCESGGALEALAKSVAGALRGFGGDERFSAHLTLARVKRKADLRQFLERHRPDEFGTFRADRFGLVSSVLGPGGPKYTIIATFMAEGGDA